MLHPEELVAGPLQQLAGVQPGFRRGRRAIRMSGVMMVSRERHRVMLLEESHPAALISAFQGGPGVLHGSQVGLSFSTPAWFLRGDGLVERT